MQSKKCLIINPIGGLANRMRSIVSGIALANKLRIDRKIVWTCNSDLYCRFDSLFEYSDQLPEFEYVNNISDLYLFDLPRKKNFYLADIFQIGRYIAKYCDNNNFVEAIEKNILSEEISRLNGGKILIRSGLQYYDFDKSLFIKLLKPKQHIINSAKNRLNGNSGRFIGVHIRRTDNDMSIKYSPIELFIDAMRKEIEANKDIKFYLATDDEQIKESVKSKFGERIVCSDKKADRKTREGIIEGFTEMIALSQCNRIYGSYWSSFSEAAAMLGDKPFIQLKIKL